MVSRDTFYCQNKTHISIMKYGLKPTVCMVIPDKIKNIIDEGVMKYMIMESLESIMEI